MINKAAVTFELDKRESELDVLLIYARSANLYAEVSIDDSIDLPEDIPANGKSEGIPVGR